MTARFLTIAATGTTGVALVTYDSGNFSSHAGRMQMTSAIATLPETTTAVDSADEQWLEAAETESPVRISPRCRQMLSILNGLFDEQQPATTDE